MADAVQEDITKHQLGEDFQTAKPLNLGEMLKAMKARKEADVRGEGNTSRTTAFQKCYEYVGKFMAPGLTEDSQLNSISQLLSKPEYSLTELEKALIVNLLPGSAEEAKILIPSLMVERKRVAEPGAEDPMDGDMMVPDDNALTGLLRDLDTHINA